MQGYGLRVFVAALGVALAGCQYEESLGPLAGATIPDELLGRWHQPADPANEERKHDGFLVIHRTRGQRLLVDYEFEDGDGRAHWYFTGHPVLAGHPELIELELVGDATGKSNTDAPYLLARWRRDGERLVWQLLDPEKLTPGKGGAEFRKLLAAALAEGKDIFDKEHEFQRIAKGS